MRSLNTPEIDIAIFGFLFNFVWEVWQAPLFENMANMTATEATSHCTLAALGDVVILLGSFWVIALTARSRNWIFHPKALNVAGFISIGVVITVVLEAAAIHFHRWQYADAMPTLPILGTGITPVLQWLTIPPISVLLVRRQQTLGQSRSHVASQETHTK